MAVDALFEGGELQDVVHGEGAGFGDFAFDGDAPRRGFEILRIFRRVGLVGAEFVEIVVVRYIVEWSDLFIGTERALDGGQLGSGIDVARRRNQIQQTRACESGNACDSHPLEKLTAVQVHRLGGDVGVDKIWRAANQHISPGEEWYLNEFTAICGDRMGFLSRTWLDKSTQNCGRGAPLKYCCQL